MDSTPPPLTGHLTQAPPRGAAHSPPKGIHLGREHVPWTPEVWEAIDKAVHHEMKRTLISARVLPHHRVGPQVTSVESETVLANPTTNTPFSPLAAATAPSGTGSGSGVTTGITATPMLNIDEGATIRLIELWTEFSMTTAQVHKENELHKGKTEHPEAEEHGGGDAGHPSHHAHHPSSAGVTLARRAANILSLGYDSVVFQGFNATGAPASGGNPAVSGLPLFTSGVIQNRGIPSDTGLLFIGGPYPLPPSQVIQVPQLTAPAGVTATGPFYSESTVGAINTAYSRLSSTGYPGPYVCILHSYPYADSFAPLPTTLILPADRIKPLLEEGYHASITLTGVTNPVYAPPGLASGSSSGSGSGGGISEPQFTGLVISLGGNTVDLVNGLDPITAFSQVDTQGNFTFRVLTRFIHRPKDFGAFIRLEFQ
jgi:hypothetical protein